jgi:hypothetical protein
MTLWSPSNYTAGLLKVWHDPSNSANITQSGGVISSDADLSGGGFPDVASGTPQPTYSTAAINSLNAETFASSVHQFFTGGIGYNTFSKFSVVWVVQRTATSTYKTLVGAGAADGFQLRISSTHFLEALRQNTTLIATSSSTVPTTTAIVVFTHDPGGGPWTFRINGTAASSGSSIQSYLNTSSLVGRNGSNTTEDFDGIIGERLTIGGVSLSDIQIAEGYLAWKWGTVSTLDASHPYKSAAPTIVFMFPRNKHYVRR